MIEFDIHDKLVKCKLSDCILKSDIKDLHKLITSVDDISNYSLRLDIDELGACVDDLPLISELMTVCMDTPFKERYFIRPVDADAYAQVVGASGLRFYDKFKVVIDHEQLYSTLELEGIENEFLKTAFKLPKDETKEIRQVLDALYEVITQAQESH